MSYISMEGNVLQKQNSQYQQENKDLRYQVAVLESQLKQQQQTQQMLVRELQESKQLMQRSAIIQQTLVQQQQQLQNQIAQSQQSITTSNLNYMQAGSQTDQTQRILEKQNIQDMQGQLFQQKLQIQNLEAQIQKDRDQQISQQQQIGLLQFQLDSKNETINTMVLIQNDLQEKLRQSQGWQNAPTSSGAKQPQTQQQQQNSLQSSMQNKMQEQIEEIAQLQKKLDGYEYKFQQKAFQMQRKYNELLIENQQIKQQQSANTLKVKELQMQNSQLKAENTELMDSLAELNNVPPQRRVKETAPNAKAQPSVDTLIDNIKNLVKSTTVSDGQKQQMEYDSRGSSSSSYNIASAERQAVSRDDILNINGRGRVQSIQFDTEIPQPQMPGKDGAQVTDEQMELDNFSHSGAANAPGNSNSSPKHSAQQHSMIRYDQDGTGLQPGPVAIPVQPAQLTKEEQLEKVRQVLRDVSAPQQGNQFDFEDDFGINDLDGPSPATTQ